MKRILFLVILLMFSCAKEEVRNLEVKAENEKLTFISKGEIKKVKIMAADDVMWELSTKSDWLKIEGLNGKGTQEVTISALENKEYELRNAEIIISGPNVIISKIMISQYAAEKILDTKVENLNFPFDGGEQTLKIISKGVSWKASLDVDWLTLSTDSGDKDAEIIVSAVSSSQADVRNAIITINGDGFRPINVYVEQRGTTLSVEEMYGVFYADYAKWDLELPSTFYPITDDIEDPDGIDDAVPTCTAMEFCQKYADDYNADKKPETPATAEDCSYDWYNNMRYMRFEISKDTISMVRFIKLFEDQETGMELYDITGTYEYDEKKMEFQIRDVSVESKPRNIVISVNEFDRNGKFVLLVPDDYWYCAVTYDGLIEYLPSVTTYYNLIINKPSKLNMKGPKFGNMRYNENFIGLIKDK